MKIPLLKKPAEESSNCWALNPRWHCIKPTSQLNIFLMNDQLKENDKLIGSNYDDPIVIAILDTLSVGKAATFKDVAYTIANERRKPKDGPNLWRRYLNAVKQQAIHLAKSGRIIIIRKGEPVDPKKIKGIVTMCLPPK
jgi:hypothetical protein